MTHLQIPEHFTYGNIVYEVAYTIADNTADVITRPVEIPDSTGVPYSFDISNGAFIYHDRLADEKHNTVFISALTTFLNNHVAL